MTKLCNLFDIADGASQKYSAEVDGRLHSVLVVRRGESVHAYLNTCPHTGAPLDFQPGQFLNMEKTHIQCANHGALFRIKDGHCIAGPCVGKTLQEVACEVRGDEIHLV